jgi:hypothetical protein
MIPYPGLVSDTPTNPTHPSHSDPMDLTSPTPTDTTMTEASPISPPTSTAPPKRAYLNPKRRKKQKAAREAADAPASAPDSAPQPDPQPSDNPLSTHTPDPQPSDNPLSTHNLDQPWLARLSTLRKDPILLDNSDLANNAITAFIESGHEDAATLPTPLLTKLFTNVRIAIANTLLHGQDDLWAQEYIDTYCSLHAPGLALTHWDNLSNSVITPTTPLQPIHIKALAIASHLNIVVIPQNTSSDPVGDNIRFYSRCPSQSTYSTGTLSHNNGKHLYAAELHSFDEFLTLWNTFDPIHKDTFIFLIQDIMQTYTGTTFILHPPTCPVDFLQLSSTLPPSSPHHDP